MGSQNQANNLYNASGQFQTSQNNFATPRDNSKPGKQPLQCLGTIPNQANNRHRNRIIPAKTQKQNHLTKNKITKETETKLSRTPTKNYQSIDYRGRSRP